MSCVRSALLVKLLASIPVMLRALTELHEPRLVPFARSSAIVRACCQHRTVAQQEQLISTVVRTLSCVLIIAFGYVVREHVATAMSVAGSLLFFPETCAPGDDRTPASAINRSPRLLGNGLMPRLCHLLLPEPPLMASLPTTPGL